MKKFIAFMLAVMLVVCLVPGGAVMENVIAYAYVSDSGNPSDNGGTTGSASTTGELQGARVVFDPYKLVLDYDEMNREQAKVLSQLVPQDDENGVFFAANDYYLDQMGAILDGRASFTKAFEFVMGIPSAKGGEDYSFRFELPESTSQFPNADKDLFITIPGYGKLTIPAQSVEGVISSLNFSFAGDELKVDAFAGDEALTGFDMVFESVEGANYTLYVPEEEVTEDETEAPAEETEVKEVVEEEIPEETVEEAVEETGEAVEESAEEPSEEAAE